jgi:ribosomal protein S18 acetylase RimI-like enzyme
MKTTITHISLCEEGNAKQAKRIYDIIKDTVCFDMPYADFKRYLAQNTALKIIIAKRENKMVGSALYFVHDYLQNKEVFVEWFAVDKECRRQGIGKMIMDALKKHGAENQMAIRFYVYSENTEAIKFYKSIGASRISEGFIEMALL